MAIFVALLAAAGIVIWQHNNARDGASMAAQSQEGRSVPGTHDVPVAEGNGLQVDAALQVSQGISPDPIAAATISTATPIVSEQPDPFSVFLKAGKSGQPSPAAEHPAQQNSQAMQDPFKQALEESKRKSAAAAASPFGSSK